MDRNIKILTDVQGLSVALRKESVDRNNSAVTGLALARKSLSARRAWIEIVPKNAWRIAM